MNGLDILNRCRTYDHRRERLVDRIAAREDAIQRITAIYGKIDGGHASGEHDKMTEYVSAKEELTERLKKLDEAYAVELAAAADVLDALSKEARTILNEFYVKCSTISAIALNVGYSEGHVRRLKRAAEREISELYAEVELPEWYKEYIAD